MSRQEEYYHRIDKFLGDPEPIQSSLEDPAPLVLPRRCHAESTDQLAASNSRYSDDEIDDLASESADFSVSGHSSSASGAYGAVESVSPPTLTFHGDSGPVFPSRVDDMPSDAITFPAEPSESSETSAKSLKREYDTDVQ